MLRHRCLLLSLNKSTGYRWNPIPKPPPPGTDRLYGTHSVLSALRVFADSNTDSKDSDSSVTDITGMMTAAGAVAVDGSGAGSSPTASVGGDAAALAALITSNDKIISPSSSSFSVVSNSAAAGRQSLSPPPQPQQLRHPHRGFVNCLYVRDFSIEEEEGDNNRGGSNNSNHGDRRKKVIPAQYSSVHRIAALAKACRVPLRFVPRSDLWKLCGERRNQNVVLEVGSYEPATARDASGLMTAFFNNDNSNGGGADNGKPDRKDGSNGQPLATSITTTAKRQRQQQQVVLYLDRIIDPTNIGSIVRTAYFFGVDHVILSPDCAGCTPAVARTSTGFLECVNVIRSAVPTRVFLANTKQAFTEAEGEGGVGAEEEKGHRALEIIASTAHRPRRPQQHQHQHQQPQLEAEAGTAGSPNSSPTRRFRVVVLGNEDAGLSREVTDLCTHLLHIKSPRQDQLRRLGDAQRQNLFRSNAAVATAASHDGVDAASSAVDGVVDSTDATTTTAAVSTTSRTRAGAVSEEQRRALTALKMRQLRPSEVTLNVNTACATLLSRLVAEDNENDDEEEDADGSHGGHDLSGSLVQVTPNA